jgi:hypothetical protein
MTTPNTGDANLQRELRDHAWDTAHAKLKQPAREQLQAAIDAWLSGDMTVENAAAAVRAVVPVDPATLPLNPRNARIVDGQLYKKTGKKWVASDGSVLAADA